MDLYLICKICKGTYEDPRVLPCFHSFCFSCLESHVHKKKTNIKKEVECPLCELTFYLCFEDLVNLKKNHYISKWISLEMSLNLSSETEFVLGDENAPHMIDLCLSKVQREIEWTLETIDEVNARLNDLEDNLKEESRRINEYAQKLGDEKNKKELFGEINAFRREHGEILDTFKVNLLVNLFGLQHYEEKIKCCINEDENQLVIAICNCKRFIELSSNLKDFDIKRSLKMLRFIQYPSNSYVLGLLGYDKDDDGIASHINPREKSGIVSVMQFSKKLRTAAYCDTRSELFLLFPSCKEILVFKETSSKVEHAASNGIFSEASRELVPFGSRMDRKIVVKCLEDANDAVVCLNFIFISERSDGRLHRISITGDDYVDQKHWNTYSYNNGLSVTPVNTILVACNSTKCLIEYTIEGLKIRTVNLARLEACPRHALFLPNEFYRTRSRESEGDDAKERNKSCNYFAVCLVSSKHNVVIVNSSGEVEYKLSSSAGELKYPVNMTLIKIDSRPSFLICDRMNCRFLSVDQNLTSARELSFRISDDILEQKRNNSPSIQYTQTLYDASSFYDDNNSKIYKLKYPAKTLLTDLRYVFVVDEDNSSLLKLENISS